MAEEKPTEIQRVYEQPPDAISFYSDMGQIIATGTEVVIQFYETIPGPPGPAGHPLSVKSRLRATITLSHSHAARIGKLILEKIERKK